MFFVFNKRKIKSYLISIGTVMMLFAVSLFASNDNNNTVKTSTALISSPIYKIETQIKKVAISINCCENAENIDSIIDTLSKMNAKATFYITGEWADKYPEVVKKIANNGHEIGNLSYHYTNLKKKSKDEINQEIAQCTQKIEKIINTKVKTFRAPYGEISNEIVEQAQQQQLFTVQWNVDSLDYNGLNMEEMCERINDGLVPGSIILLHNTGKHTAESMEEIVHNIRQQKYELCTVSELIAL